MKKLLKEHLKTIITIVITSVVATTTTIFAYSLVANEVGYTPHDTTWDVGDVEAAIDDLHLRTKQLVANYSTDETVVGRWVDGKPLYQKTFIFTSMTITNEQYNFGSLSGLNLDYANIIDVNFEEDGYYIGEGDIKVWVRKPNNNFGTISLNTTTRNGTLFFTIQYTKTTD